MWPLPSRLQIVHGLARQGIPRVWPSPVIPPEHGCGQGGTKMSDALQTILRNHMKEKLARNEVVASMTVRFSRSIEIAQIAKTAGFDTLYVDMEHNTLTIGETCQICIAAQ